MKGTKPPQKATIILCLSFPNKHQKTGGDFALEITKKKKFFLAN